MLQINLFDIVTLPKNTERKRISTNKSSNSSAMQTIRNAMVRHFLISTILIFLAFRQASSNNSVHWSLTRNEHIQFSFRYLLYICNCNCYIFNGSHHQFRIRSQIVDKSNVVKHGQDTKKTHIPTVISSAQSQVNDSVSKAIVNEICIFLIPSNVLSCRWIRLFVIALILACLRDLSPATVTLQAYIAKNFSFPEV